MAYIGAEQTHICAGSKGGGVLVEKTGTLDLLSVGQRAEIAQLDTSDEFRARLMALGFVPGGSVETVLESPWGDPVAYEVCGAVIALRRADARQIFVTNIE